MQKLKISYAHDEPETVASEHVRLDGDWFVFTNGTANTEVLILRVRANSVVRVENAA